MAGFCCIQCGDFASCDLTFLDLFRPNEGADCFLVREAADDAGERYSVRLPRSCFGNTAYLRIFLKPNKFSKPLTFDIRRICDVHMLGKCPRGAECTMLHPCRKMVHKYFLTPVVPAPAAVAHAAPPAALPVPHAPRAMPIPSIQEIPMQTIQPMTAPQISNDKLFQTADQPGSLIIRKQPVKFNPTPAVDLTGYCQHEICECCPGELEKSCGWLFSELRGNESASFVQLLQQHCPDPLLTDAVARFLELHSDF